MGVFIDSRLIIKKHAEYICQKALNLVNILARIMPNIDGPKYSRRILLSQVTNQYFSKGHRYGKAHYDVRQGKI